MHAVLAGPLRLEQCRICFVDQLRHGGARASECDADAAAERDALVGAHDLALPDAMGLQPGDITVTPQGLVIGFVNKKRTP